MRRSRLVGMERKCLPGWEVVYAKALRWGSLVLGERTDNEGLVGSRARFGGVTGYRRGSVCRVWYILLRKRPVAGVNPEAGAAMSLGSGELQ